MGVYLLPAFSISAGATCRSQGSSRLISEARPVPGVPAANTILNRWTRNLGDK